jgi:hypothetical protein
MFLYILIFKFLGSRRVVLFEKSAVERLWNSHSYGIRNLLSCSEMLDYIMNQMNSF